MVLRGMRPSGGGPRLVQSALVRGDEETFTVTGAAAEERVQFLYSLAGPGDGPCFPQLGGLSLDLLNPIKKLGRARADASGTAALRLRVPPGAPLRSVSTQAVIVRGVDGAGSVESNTVTDVIRP